VNDKEFKAERDQTMTRLVSLTVESHIIRGVSQIEASLLQPALRESSSEIIFSISHLQFQRL